MAKLTLQDRFARAEKDRRCMENVRAIRRITAGPRSRKAMGIVTACAREIGVDIDDPEAAILT